MQSQKTLFLLGPMGSGKTFIGKQLAKASGTDFQDLDKLIEQKEKKSISALFESKGETAFRLLEADTLRAIRQQGILATGGGTPCFHNNMRWMNENGITLYLRTPADILTNRLQSEASHRPLISGLTPEEIKGFLEAMITEREQYYEQAHIIYNQTKNGFQVVEDLEKFIQPFFLNS